jgi:hypothetical protein
MGDAAQQTEEYGGIGRIKTEADLKTFVETVTEQRPMNTIAGLVTKITELEGRLVKGGL